MAKYAPADIRNIAFVGGAHSGKTTLVEALLSQAGAIPRRGSVTEGTSQVDYDPDERELKHSLFLKVFHCSYEKRELNLIDTPGYPDFIGEALQALNAVETAVVCVDATQGVTFQTRRIWNEVVDAKRGRLLVVTRCDAEGVDIDSVIGQIREAFGERCVPSNLPVDAGPNLSVFVDVLDGTDEAPESVKETMAASHEQLVESLVTLDDAAMERYLETGEASLDELIPLMKQGVARGTLTPILFVAAEKDLGLRKLLHFISEDCPSPVDGPFFEASAGDEVSDELSPIDPGGRSEFAARVFKSVSDPFVGRLTYFRVISGEVKTDQLYSNPRIGKHEKMGHILRPQGKESETVDFAQAGDIVAVAKIETLEANDTLCDEHAMLRIPDMGMPRPMVSMAVSAKNRNEDQKMGTGLKKLVAEDPTLTLERDSQTGELILSGVSELHVNTVLNRLNSRFKTEVETKVPRVPLRETCLGVDVEGHHRHKKQTGGRGQFGEVHLKVSANERGQGFEFVDGTHGGSVPKNFMPAIEKGVIDHMQKGVVAGYPVVDVTVSVYDGKHHDVDSDEMSFKLAGARAFRDAFEKAKPVLLEPIVHLEVAVPSRFMGDITSDLNGRRGRIAGMEALGDIQVISADIPLKEIQTYAPDLRSMTQGEGSFTYEFKHYDVVPHNVAQEMMESFKAGEKDEED